MTAFTILPLQIKRQYSDSLDPDDIFDTVSELNAYLTNPLRYAGQIVSCLEVDSSIYVLNLARNAWISMAGLYAPIIGSANYIQNQSATPQSATMWITGAIRGASVNATGAITGGSIVKTGGVSTQFLKADGSVDTNTYLTGNQAITLSGEASGTGATSINVTLLESAVTGKLLTGLNTIGGGSISTTDSILVAFGKVQNQLTALLGGVTFQTVWNASTNSPTITNGVGTKGHYYVVNVSGTTTFNGISEWKVGDWIIYDGTNWQKVDNTDAVSSVNGFMGAVSLTSDNISEGATNKYYLDSRARNALSSGTGINYVSSTGVINCTITQYTDTAARASLSSGTGINYVSSTGVINCTITQFTTTDARNALSQGTGISYSSSTGVIACTITQYTNSDARNTLSSGTGINYVASTGVINCTITQFTTADARNSLSQGAGINYVASTGVIACTITQFTTTDVRNSLSSGTGINYVASTGVINCTITQYTNSDTRAAISLSTTGSSGAGTYTQATGVFNIPNYTLAGLNGESAGTAAGIMSTHNSTYNHGNIANGQTAYSWGDHASRYLPLIGGAVSGPVTVNSPGFRSYAFDVTSNGGVAIIGTANGSFSYGIVGMSDNIAVQATALNGVPNQSKLGLLLHGDVVTPEAGFGVNMGWRFPSASVDPTETFMAGDFGAVLTNPTVGVEAAKFEWKLVTNGSVQSRMTLSDTGNLYTVGSGTFAGGGFNSLRSMKNINEDWNGSAMDVIDGFKLRDFHYKSRPNSDRTLGFIIDEVPANVREYFLMGEEYNAINNYTMIGISFKAHQEEKAELDILKKRVLALEEIINN